jgi:DNA-binding response OmpR family regulator
MNRVLIVDDEKSVREVTAEMVSKMGFIPITASSAKEALDIFHEEQPNIGIVLSDLRLGGDMDGVALCSKIRYEDNTVAMLAMSGFFSEYDKIYVLAAGFQDFISKPVDSDELNSALQCAFDRRARWRALP